MDDASGNGSYRSVRVELGPDGTREGHLSTDDNLFLLPQFEAGVDSRSVSLLLGLREPWELVGAGPAPTVLAAWAGPMGVSLTGR